MADPKQLENFAFWVHKFLGPLWAKHHGKLGYDAPYIPSTHLCRETSTFGLMILEKLGQTGWRIEFGEVCFDEDDDIPIDVLDVDVDGIPDRSITSAPHAWLTNDETGYNIDLTADQFGRLLIPTGDGPVISHVSDHFYEIADEPQDWENDPQIVMAAEEWMTAPRIDDLIDNVKEDLSIDIEAPLPISSIAPAEVRETLMGMFSVGAGNCQPTSAQEAMDLILLNQEISKVQNLTPRAGARDEALSILKKTIDFIDTKWDPSSEEDRKEKSDMLERANSLLSLSPEVSPPTPPCP